MLLCKLCTHCLRDLVVLEALEVAVLVHAVHHDAALWFHPALCHQVELRVHVYGLHLGVVVIISGEAGGPGKRQYMRLTKTSPCSAGSSGQAGSSPHRLQSELCCHLLAA